MTMSSEPQDTAPGAKADESIVQEIEEAHARIRDQALHDSVLTRDDLILSLGSLLKLDISLAVLFTAYGKFVPAMSIVRRRGKTLIKDTGVRLMQEKDDLVKAAPEPYHARERFTDVYISGTPFDASKLAQRVAVLCDAVFSQTLPARNLVRDRRNDLIDRLRHDIDNHKITTILGLASFLRRQLRISIHVVDKIGQEITWLDKSDRPDPSFSKLLEHKPFQEVIESAVATGKPFDYGLRLPDSHPDDYKVDAAVILVLPVRSIADPGLKRSEVFIIDSISASRLPQHSLIQTINRCFDLFLARKYRLGQTDTLSKLTFAVEKSLLDPPLNGYADLVKRLDKMLNDVCVSAAASTAAHSVAILEFHPERNVLRRFHVYNHPSTKLYKSQHADDDHRSRPSEISARKWREYLSAFAFRHAGSRPFVYVPNIDNIPSDLKELGLQRVTTTRDSRCEIAIPIKRGRLVSGVINFEARNKHAFDSDIPFFQAIASGMASLITSTYQSSDVTWVIENVRMLENLHQLKNEVDRIARLTAHAGRAKEIMQSLYERRMKREGSVSLLRKLDELSTYVSEPYQGTEQYAQARHFLTYDVPDDIQVSERFATGLEIIVENLCSNWIRYGDKEHDFVKMRLIKADGLTSTSLLIGVGFHKWTRDEVLDAAFVTPMSNSGRVADGLFIIGATVRTLRGTLGFTREPIIESVGNEGYNRRKLYLNIMLPMT